MRSGRPLPQAFYCRDALVVAQELIGCVLERRCDGGVLRGQIVETEAYAQDDPASHAYGGRTARNSSMFGPAGRAYVYRIYGVHCCLNAVTNEEGRGEAVLIRALAPLDGLHRMSVNRGVAEERRLCRGPGALCEALEIDLSLDGTPLGEWPLRIVQGDGRAHPLACGPRVGVTRASDRPWRFCLAGSPFVSAPALSGGATRDLPLG